MRRKCFRLPCTASILYVWVAAFWIPPIVAAMQAAKHAITLQVTTPGTPGKDSRQALITIREGEIGVLEVPELGRFGFQPTFATNSKSRIVAVIFDHRETPPRRLGDVNLEVTGSEVQTKTSPSFLIRVFRVVEIKS